MAITELFPNAGVRVSVEGTPTRARTGLILKPSWLRWAGSKWRALPALRPILESREYEVYIDPFVGAGTIFLELAKPVQAVLADSNRDLISFYRFLKHDPNTLWKEIACFPSRISSKFYKSTRERFNRLPRNLERAATFFFLNRTCYNGIYRINRRGEFNVPIGSRREFKYPSFDILERLSEKLQQAEILDCDFSQTSRYARPGSLYYLDPPYTAMGRARGYDRYSWPPFRKADLHRLENFVFDIVRRGADVVISYSGSKIPWFLPPQFSTRRYKVFRSMSSNGTRGHKIEVCAYLWQQGARQLRVSDRF